MNYLFILLEMLSLFTLQTIYLSKMFSCCFSCYFFDNYRSILDMTLNKDGFLHFNLEAQFCMICFRSQTNLLALILLLKKLKGLLMLHMWRLKVWKMELELLNSWADTVVSVVELYIAQGILQDSEQSIFFLLSSDLKEREKKKFPTFVLLPQSFIKFLFAGFIATFATLASRDVVIPQSHLTVNNHLLLISRVDP